MATKKHDWEQLKVEFMASPHLTVTSFLTEKGIPLSNSVKTTGWTEEKEKNKKDVLTATTQKMLQEDAQNLVDVRLRQARMARFMQLKGMAKLKSYDENLLSPNEARRLITSGLEEERKALGMEGGGSQSYTQINIIPKTNIDKLVEGLDYEGILGFIAELKRERTKRLAGHSVTESTGDIQEGEAV